MRYNSLSQYVSQTRTTKSGSNDVLLATPSKSIVSPYEVEYDINPVIHRPYIIARATLSDQLISTVSLRFGPVRG